MIGLVWGGFVGMGVFLLIKNAPSLRYLGRPKFDLGRIPADLAIGFLALIAAEMLWGSAIFSLGSFAVGFVSAQLIGPYRQKQLHQSNLFREALQLPELVDLLSISLTAGVPLASSFAQTLPRVSNLLQNFWNPLMDKNVELTFLTRLELVSRLNPESASGLLANQLLVSVERGTAMLPVLEAFATDLRSRNQRVLLERAAKKDVWMMVPVVFGILPAVTVIAIYPAMISLSNI